MKSCGSKSVEWRQNEGGGRRERESLIDIKARVCEVGQGLIVYRELRK